MAHLDQKPEYKPVKLCFFKIITRLFVALLVFVYFQYFYQTFNISWMIFTDIKFQHKAYSELFAVSVCFDFSEKEFFGNFCHLRLNSFECDKFLINLERELDKYEIRRSFDQSIKMKEDQDLSRVYYNWSNKFCVKFFKRENRISIKNKFYYSVKLCRIYEANEEYQRFLQRLMFRIYIHKMDTKPDLVKDYVYKFFYRSVCLTVFLFSTLWAILKSLFFQTFLQARGQVCRGEHSFRENRVAAAASALLDGM